MVKDNIKEFTINENPYIRSAYIIFSETYNFTKTAPYSPDVRKSLEELIKLLYRHLKYPEMSDYEIVDELYSKKIICKFDDEVNNDNKRI